MSRVGIERDANASIVAMRSAIPSSAKYSQLSGIRTRVGGDERVERQQPERRRRVDEDVVEVGAQAIEEPRSRCSRSRQRDELDFGAGEVAIRRDEREVIDAGVEDERAGSGGSPVSA